MKTRRKLVESAAARKRRCERACLRKSGTNGPRLGHLHPRVVLGEVRPTRPIMHLHSNATLRYTCKPIQLYAPQTKISEIETV